MNDSSARTLSAMSLAVAAACLFSLTASAGDKSGCPRDATHTTVTRDVEGGALLTSASHRASAAKRFELMDTDKDGKVTAAEIGSSRGAESIAWASKMTSAKDKIRALDSNRDGVLTAAEYADSSQKMFDTLDVDGDGVLSEAEMLMPSTMSAR